MNLLYILAQISARDLSSNELRQYSRENPSQVVFQLLDYDPCFEVSVSQSCEARFSHMVSPMQVRPGS